MQRMPDARRGVCTGSVEGSSAILKATAASHDQRLCDWHIRRAGDPELLRRPRRRCAGGGAGRLRDSGFSVCFGRDASGAAASTTGRSASSQRDAQGRGAQRRAHPAWHRRQRRAVHARRVRRRAVRRPASALDAAKFFIILPDGIGHGQSSKPSDGLRARFPRYGYIDMVEAQYRLFTEGLGVNHLRLVMGTSMGGMHTWLWGERYPDFMDALHAARQPARRRSPAAIASGAGSSSTRSATTPHGAAATTQRSRRACAPRNRCCS